MAFGQPVIFDFVHGVEESSGSDFISASVDLEEQEKNEQVDSQDNSEQQAEGQESTKPEVSVREETSESVKQPVTSKAKKTASTPPFRNEQNANLAPASTNPPFRNPLPDIKTIDLSSSDSLV